MVSKLLILALIVSTASAATFIGRVPQKPRDLAHKEGCFISQIRDVIPFGATVNPLGECISISCTSDLVHYATCGVVSTNDSKCHITDEDLSKPYPHCCPTAKCDLDNNLI